MAPLSLTLSPMLASPFTARGLRCRASRPAPRCRVPALRTQALFGGGGGGDGQQGGGGNPFGNMANLMENLKKTQALVQQETAKVQEELAQTEFEGFSEDETVRVVMTGNQVPVSVDITQAAYGQGKEKLEELLLEASKEAHEKSVTGMKDRMKVLAQTLGLPAQPGV